MVMVGYHNSNSKRFYSGGSIKEKRNMVVLLLRKEKYLERSRFQRSNYFFTN